MGTRGPVPRPQSHRTARGPAERGPARRRSPVVAIDPSAGPPEPPDDLGEGGRRAWVQFWTASWLIPADETGVRILCQLIDAIDDFEAQIKSEGRTSSGSKGQPVAHPLVAAVHALRASFLAWVGDYGFSPMSRARMRIEIVPRTEPRILDRHADPYANLYAPRADPRDRLREPS